MNNSIVQRPVSTDTYASRPFGFSQVTIAASGAKPADVLKIIVLIVDHNQDYLQPLHDAIEGLFPNQSTKSMTCIV